MSDITTETIDTTRLKKRFAIALGVALLLFGAFALYGALTATVRAPYKQAYERYKVLDKTTAALIASGASINASGADDETFKKSVENTQAALEVVKAENEALGKEEVLQSGEGKDAYATFNEMLQKYITYNANILSSMSTVRPIVYACTQAMNGATATPENAQEMRDCATKFANADAVADDDYKQLAESFESIYADFATNLAASAALKDPKGSDAVQEQTLADEREQLLTVFTNASNTFNSNVQIHRTAVLTTNADTILKNYLKKKSSVIQL